MNEPVASVKRVSRRQSFLGTVTLAGAAGAALSGCGAGPTGGSATEEAAQLRMLHNWGPAQVHSQALADLVQEYTTARPNVSIALEYNPSGDAYVAKLRALLAAGTPPHVATLLQDYLPSMAPALAPIEGLIGQRVFNKSDIFDGPLGAATFNGMVVGAPYISTNQGMAVNQSAFQAMGQTAPKETWTWKELVEAGRRVATEGRFGVQVPFGTQGWLPYLWQAGGEVLDRSGKKAVFNQQPGRDALQLVVDMVHRYQASPPPGASGDFTKGEVAIIPAWAGALSSLVKQIESFTWTTIPFPKQQRSATILSGHAMTVLKEAPLHAAAGRFVHWFTSAPQLARFNSRTFTLPPRKSGQNQPAWQEFARSEPRLKVYTDSMAFARATPSHLKWQEMSVVIAGAITKAAKQEMSPPAALDDAARQVDALAQQG